MNSRAYSILAILLIIACQVIPTPPPLRGAPTGTGESPPATQATSTDSVPPEKTRPPASLEPALAPNAPGEMPPFPYQAAGPFAQVEMVDWEPGQASQVDVSLPIPLGEVGNLEVADGLTTRQRDFLARNGFAVVRSQEAQFGEIRERAATRFGQPYYLTCDAAYHALHLAFDETLKALEREELRRRMIAVTQATLKEVVSYIPLTQGTSLEADTLLAAAYLAVGLRLFDPQAEVDAALEEQANAQVEQIMAGAGVQYSVLIPSFKDDYSAYKPVGHYTGEADLESYFRGMTWFGRVHFELESPYPGSVGGRLPLIITLALRRARLENGESAAQEWARVHEALTFLVGPSDDNGPAEYAPLMDQVYGSGATIVSLPDEASWNYFLILSQQLPPPAINSTFADSLQRLESEQGWRFMGQRFSIDAFILQNLVFDKVSVAENKRELPSGLDVMAALGSQAAMQALEAAGETAYANYLQQMSRLQTSVQSQDQAGWQSSLYSAWLYAFLPQVGAKPQGFPPAMRTTAWSYKDLNSALGSWAELKHDTALYVKMPETAGGGGPPASGPAPGYVEPDPLVFYRLAYLAQATVEGLRQRDMLGVFSMGPENLAGLLGGMQALGEQLQALGDIAARELQGEPLDEDDYYTIQSPLGPAEARWLLSQRLSMYGVGQPLEMPPVPVIAAAAGGGERILQVGVGALNRIYVVVPLGGELQVAQGGVFSYYEFPWPRAGRLDDAEWRHLLVLSPPEPPKWDENFILPDGNPIDVLAFRIGDVYRITLAGNRLNLRKEPTRNASVARQLLAGAYVTIIDGPAQAEGYTWWKFRLEPFADPLIEGWAVEQAEWYERAWGQ
ncbi:MAG: DUF3160 domain-containing protein [Anaerolineales bacterium]|nr:DUF3160 domain-containing protein [Anaerolineales bacterium]